MSDRGVTYKLSMHVWSNFRDLLRNGVNASKQLLWWKMYLQCNVTSSQLLGNHAPAFSLSTLHSFGLSALPLSSLTPTPTLAVKWIPPPDSGHFEASLLSSLLLLPGKQWERDNWSNSQGTLRAGEGHRPPARLTEEGRDDVCMSIRVCAFMCVQRAKHIYEGLHDRLKTESHTECVCVSWGGGMWCSWVAIFLSWQRLHLPQSHLLPPESASVMHAAFTLMSPLRRSCLADVPHA